MASTDVLKRQENRFTFPSLSDPLKGDMDSRDMSIEKKIEFLESLTGKVTNRKTRRWLNDRLLMELVPRLNAEEIRGLFAPPPWGDNVRPTTFSTTNAGDWDKFRSIDMDKEAKFIGVLENSSIKRKGHIDADKVAFLNAWRRIECQTREALRRSFLPELVEAFENSIRSFVLDSSKEDVLTLRVRDPFRRLLLHGVCEVDAFTDTPFKGNPAAVCLLEEEKDDKWLQDLAAEFNISETSYLVRINEEEETDGSLKPPKFGLRWFTPVTEVNLCGHATLAAAHTLFSTGLVNSDIIEFSTLSGKLTAKRVPEVKPNGVSNVHNGEAHESYFIELDFPAISSIEVDSADVSSVSQALNVASMIDIRMTVSKNLDNILVVLPSEKEVIDFEPNFDEIRKCPGTGVIITGAPLGDSKFDFYSRFFCPKYGINEDPVCGSAHCSLAVYWAKKLGKSDFVAYMASPRSGILNIHLDEQKKRVLLRGKAITTMEGVVLV
ncbi:uncharacterized protein LOC111456018 isoform X3 [Cucurbita moschata]|uniref:Uncharacterized protein LOC111456018 isoform X3 n=1 Tax=Cucurbita moschata TaxID=3662 RepID=A0A6J1GNC4_CUCMO|nr:uncharacterized protein LOC111456018 isoform X3 [Cucurbita moschata]